ncbi:MAG: glycosyltransferase [Nanoarchaeota archaeon]|nr:glycosyltransferase [Nanoarchaeota archaeon]
MKKEAEPLILYMATYPPRECGIATFTKDISDAIDRRFFPTMKSRILAMNNNGTNIYNYPKKVNMQISDTEITDYLNTARIINESPQIKLVNIQHEFGIFGGEYGEYLLPFLELVEKPIVITFHSVLPSPNDKLKKIVREISKRVSAIIVMTKKAVEILKKHYHLKTKIHIIPHGIPNTSFESQKREKKNLSLQNKTILSSFGMIGPGKGYEYAIDSLPEVVQKFPNLLYIIVGETHPMVRKREGEKYRNFLESKVKELKLQKHVKFYNKYVTPSEIIQYLKATDIYLSPSDNPNQITSGTLSYAMGCGRAVISTPFLHAKDIVTPNRGRLVEFQNPDSFKNALLELLSNKNLIKEMEKSAFYFTRHMTWQNVATSYGRVFKEILKDRGVNIKDLPQINIKHLMRLTDNFGIIQFANQSHPDIQSGYTLDDNARALLACGMHYEKFKEYKQLRMIKTYLEYINFVRSSDGKLYNFVDKYKILDKTKWSEDAHGRAIWALGYLYSLQDIPHDFKVKAESIFLESFPATSIMTSPRAIAYTIIGLYHYNKTKKSPYIVENIKKLANFLVSLYKTTATPDWLWFESYLTYSNSKLPESLFYAYRATKDSSYLNIAEESLNFLIEKTFQNEIFSPIGQKGWYFKDKEKAEFDQQPIEAGYTVQTLITAYKTTNNFRYKKLASDAFQWFLGKNILKQALYNEETGGTHDGLGENAINLNQGAEATVSYLMARLSLMEG